MKQPGILFLAAVISLTLFGDSRIPAVPAQPDIRPAAVSGKFYPSDPAKLRLAVQQFLQDAVPASVKKPIALIVPHAGYIYSGQICADAYRQVMGNSYDTVVILGTNHTTGNFSGASVGDYAAFRTPLGTVPVDNQVLQALQNESKDCNRNRAIHIMEHSIEVQLPFIQVLFPNAKIVPIIIHPPDYDLCLRFGASLARALKNRKALIVMSSDLSHYPSQKDAARTDQRTLETIASLDTHSIASILCTLNAPNLDTRACGEAAILAGITAAKALGATQAIITSYANSGDIPGGETESTVGYGSLVLAAGGNSNIPGIFKHAMQSIPTAPLDNSERKLLLSFARKTITRRLTTDTVPLARNLPARMDFPQGAFVTLKKSGELRGCIGRLQGDIPLGQTVGAMALQAAFYDPRFPPVQQSELGELEIEISVLTPMKPVSNATEIVVGRDGVLMTKGSASAVFLPQVAVENRWNRAEMLDNLCRKAGLQTGCWKQQAKFQVFQAEVFSESNK